MVKMIIEGSGIEFVTLKPKSRLGCRPRNGAVVALPESQDRIVSRGDIPLEHTVRLKVFCDINNVTFFNGCLRQIRIFSRCREKGFHALA